MELTRPLSGPLERFEGAIDVLMQTHGVVASLINTYGCHGKILSANS